MKKRKLIKRVVLSATGLLVLATLTVFVLIPLFDLSAENDFEGVMIRGYVEDQKEYTLESNHLLFTLDATTTQFTVTQKENGRVWHSNPPEADSDPIALLSDKANLKSILTLTYSTINGVTVLFNNWEYSIERGIYEIESGDGFIKVIYSLGKVNRTYVIPPAITQERMDLYLEKMEKSESKAVTEYYRKVDLNKLRSTDNHDELVVTYPDLQEGPVYVLRDNVADYLKERIEGYFEKAEYSFDDYLYDLERCNVESSSDKPVFNIPVIYRLDGKDLVVEIPYEEIEYNPTYAITKLNLLPAFGAGGREEEGYILVPDGGGAKLSFNNGKLAQNSYFANVYGWDYAMMRARVVGETRTAFPVFGIASGENAVLCLLEDGASTAGVAADISGRYNSYNTVSAVYTILHADAFDVSEKSNSSVYLFEAELPKGQIRQRYRFIDSDSYVVMAKEYRAYLLSRYPELSEREDESVPVTVELIGAADKIMQKGGLPQSVPLKLTSYEEALSIVKTLKEAGFDNLAIKYAGWMNGGLQQKTLTSVKLLSELGDEKSLLALSSYCKENNIPLYLEGVTHFAYDSGIMEGFTAFRDAAQHTTREEVALKDYSTIWYGTYNMDPYYYLLKPRLAMQGVKTLAGATQKYGAQGIGLRDTGYLLSADYNPKELVTREMSIAIQRETMQDIRDMGLGLIINYGNDYALSYADRVLDMDLNGEGYSLLDSYVPFYQIALHGLVNYAGEALNLSADYETELLISCETGAGLNLIFMQESASVLQDSKYGAYYGADFALWFEKAREIYTTYNAKLGHVFNQEITDHQRLSDEVTLTVYEDGTRVYVNYGYQRATFEGVMIPARSYETKGGTAQ